VPTALAVVVVVAVMVFVGAVDELEGLGIGVVLLDDELLACRVGLVVVVVVVVVTVVVGTLLALEALDLSGDGSGERDRLGEKAWDLPMREPSGSNASLLEKLLDSDSDGRRCGEKGYWPGALVGNVPPGLDANNW
jgi:hypothetical protein